MGNIDIHKALLEAAQTEKDAMDFYKFGAEKMSDDKASATFKMLALDEKEHARSFYDSCDGSDLPSFDDFINAAPDTDSTWWKALQSLLVGDFDERKAMELAMDQEALLETELRAMAAKIDDPKVKAVYLANAESTHRHEELIGADYKDIYC